MTLTEQTRQTLEVICLREWLRAQGLVPTKGCKERALIITELSQLLERIRQELKN